MHLGAGFPQPGLQALLHALPRRLELLMQAPQGVIAIFPHLTIG